jgi:predicted MFS family arabinose efflux permease
MTESVVPARWRAETKMGAIFHALPLTTVYALGFMSNTLLPVWIGTMSRAFGVPESRLGVISSMELGAVAIASILSAAFVDTRSRHLPIVLAVLVSIGANVLAALSPTITLLTFARIAVGLANGFLLADVNRRAAQSAVPSRIFAGQIFALVAFSVVFFAVAPLLIGSWGPGAPFFYSALVGTAALLSLSGLQKAGHAVSPQEAPSRFVFSLPIVLNLAAPTLVFMINAGAWSYLTSAAVRSGISLTNLSKLMAAGAAVNFLAPVAAAWFGGGRIPPSLAFTVGIGLFAICVYCVTGPVGAPLFSVGVLFQPFCVMFLVPFYLSQLVQLDSSGKSVGASSAFIMIGAAIGPSVGGMTLDSVGPRGLAFAGVAVVAVVSLLTFAGLAGLAKRRRPVADAPG